MSRPLTNHRNVLKERKLDALLVSSEENRRYLSGFTGSAGYLFITQDDAALATDFRYYEQVEQQAPDFRLVRVTGGSSWLPDVVAETGARRIGFESDDMTVAVHQQLIRTLKESSALEGKRVRLAPTTGITVELRALKEPNEMELLQRAIDISDQAIDRVAPTIKAGQTETEVAWQLELAMRELGAESISFDTIVGSGPNAALPHHRAGERVIQEGESIVIDMGAKYEGYCSDLTRTIVVGTPDEMFRRVYDTVLGAQLTAMATVQPGMTGAEADGLARKVIEDAGYGDNFGHGLGHGVGLAVHEHPRVGLRSEDVLQEGMVFTIEPGIYLSGWGGVRIEDVVVLEKSGARPLSKAIKQDSYGG